MKATVCVSIDGDDLRLIEEMAKEQKRSRSGMVCELLDLGLKAHAARVNDEAHDRSAGA